MASPMAKGRMDLDFVAIMPLEIELADIGTRTGVGWFGKAVVAGSVYSVLRLYSHLLLLSALITHSPDAMHVLTCICISRTNRAK